MIYCYAQVSTHGSIRLGSTPEVCPLINIVYSSTRLFGVTENFEPTMFLDGIPDPYDCIGCQTAGCPWPVRLYRLPNSWVSLLFMMDLYVAIIAQYQVVLSIAASFYGHGILDVFASG